MQLRPMCRIVYLALLVSAGSPVSSWGVGPASPDQIAELAKGAEKLLSQPAANYDKIVSRWIRPNALDSKKMRHRLQELLGRTDKRHDKAALHALIGEACYWGAPAQARATKSPAPFKDVGKHAISHFLAAWNVIRMSDEDSDVVSHLRRGLALRLRSLTATRVCGAALPEGLKKRVVVEFVDAVTSKSGGTAHTWPIEQRHRIYTNLGISDRLVAELPATPPDGYDDLARAMRMARLLKPEDGARFAAALQDKFPKKLRADSATHHEVLKAYYAVKHERTLPCARDMCQRDFNAYPVLYDISREMERELSRDDRFKYLQKYIDRSRRERPNSIGHFYVAAKRLISAEDFTNALAVTEAGLRIPASDANKYRSRLYYSQGLSLERLEFPERAIAAYSRCIESAPRAEGGHMLKDMANRALLRTRKQETKQINEGDAR